MKKKQATPNVAKIGGIVAGLVVLLVAGWFIVVAPKRSEAGKLSREIDDMRAQIAAAQTGPESPDKQTIRVADIFKLSRAMPDRADIPSVLLQLSQISSETGVSFQSITPSDPVPIGPYERISIDLVFQGHFYDLSDFLYRLRNLVGVHGGVLAATGRLFSVDSISFDEGELSFPQVKAALTVSAYVYGDGTFTSAPTVTVPPATSTEPPPAAVPSTTSTTPAADDSKPIPAAPPGATAAGASVG